MLDNIIGVRFRKTGKMLYFNNTEKENIKLGTNIIAETEKGKEIGKVVKFLSNESLSKNIEIKNIIKIASKDDILKEKSNKKEAEEILEISKKEAKKNKLDMKFLFAEYTLDKSKITIYFTASERIDFRELVKVLASKFKTRIELRQIGPRDEVKSCPNLGMCGREVCCRTYLEDFKSVTIKEAKEQGLQINMNKLSGACGRLMCCLKYEHEGYVANSKLLPKIGDIVEIIATKEKAKVINTDMLKLQVKVKIQKDKDEESIEVFKFDEIKSNNKVDNKIK